MTSAPPFDAARALRQACETFDIEAAAVAGLKNRLTEAFAQHAWINPEPQGVWQYRQSIDIIQRLMGGRMYPLSVKGLEEAMRLLSK